MGSIEFIAASIHIQIFPISPFNSARSEMLMIVLRPCEAVIRAIAADVSQCDSRGLHTRCDVPASGALV